MEEEKIKKFQVVVGHFSLDSLFLGRFLALSNAVYHRTVYLCHVIKELLRPNKYLVFSAQIKFSLCAPFMFANHRISNVAVCTVNPIKLGYEVDAVFVGIFLLLIQGQDCLTRANL